MTLTAYFLCDSFFIYNTSFNVPPKSEVEFQECRLHARYPISMLQVGLIYGPQGHCKVDPGLESKCSHPQAHAASAIIDLV